MMGYGWGMGWGGWLTMGLAFVVFWGGLIALAVWLVRTFRTEPARASSVSAYPKQADEVLAERFARGELDAEECARRRQVLRDTRPGPNRTT